MENIYIKEGVDETAKYIKAQILNWQNGCC